MAAPSELFWRLLPDVRVGERRRFLFFAGLLTLISLAQAMGLAGTEALFLAEVGAVWLPQAIIGASLLTVLTSVLYASRVGEQRNDSLYIRWLVTIAGVLLLAASVAIRGYAWVCAALFCLWYVAQAVFQNHFWTFSSDYFDTLASKRLFPLFTIGSSAGAVLGGLLAWALAPLGGLVLVAAWALVLVAAAGLLRVGRRALRRWGPLDLEEADESSVEGLRGALGFLRTSALSRWLVISALGMVLGFVLAQYLYLDLFSQRFPDQAELAAFLSLYIAGSNALEVLLEVLVTPWLIRRFGVAGANLIHPGLLLASFGAVAFQPGLPSAAGARLARESIDNAVAAPIRSLVHNAMPPRFRGRMRAFLEAIVYYAAMAVGGLLLLAGSGLETGWWCAAGALACLFYLVANWRIRRAYLETLVGQLRAGRLDLSALGDTLGGWEASRLAELWESLLRSGGERPSASLLQLVPHLARRRALEPLMRAASHPSPEVRRASLLGLAQSGDPAMAGPLALALDDPHADVRLEALRGLVRLRADTGFLAARVADLLDDASPRVRSEAALQAGRSGDLVLEQLLRSSDPDEATAALAVVPVSFAETAVERARSGPPEIRAAALECLARISRGSLLSAAERRAALHEPDPGVRRAAATLLGGLGGDEAAQLLAGALEDPAPEVQQAAVAALVACGEAGTAAVTPQLRARRERCIAAALLVVAGVGSRGARATLIGELRHRARQLRGATLAHHRLAEGAELALRFLRIAYRDAMLRERRLAFRILALLETPSVVRKVERSLHAGTAGARVNALDVLSNLADHESARMLVLIHESGPIEERLGQLGAAWWEPGGDGLDAEAVALEQPWVGMALRAAASEGPHPSEEETMERLLALKQVELFSHLSLEQAEAVLQLAKPVDYVAGEVICREGDPGDALYLLLEGEVRVVLGHGQESEIALRVLDAVDYFGEMAILDDEPRSATVVATRPSHLLALDGESFKELIRQMPELAFEVFPVLTARVREAERKLDLASKQLEALRVEACE